jgi:hypothetical protein
MKKLFVYFTLSSLIFNSCKINDGVKITGNQENSVTAKINGKEYVAKLILIDNKSYPNSTGFESTDLRDTEIGLSFPKNEIQVNKVYDLSKQPWTDIDDKIIFSFDQPNEIGRMVFNGSVKFTKIVVDKYYEGEFEVTDNYYPNRTVKITEGKFIMNVK